MPQYRKHARNAQIVLLRKSDSKKWSLQKLGDKFEISKVRVKEILDQGEKLSTPSPRGRVASR